MIHKYTRPQRIALRLCYHGITAIYVCFLTQVHTALYSLATFRCNQSNCTCACSLDCTHTGIYMQNGRQAAEALLLRCQQHGGSFTVNMQQELQEVLVDEQTGNIKGVMMSDGRRCGLCNNSGYRHVHQNPRLHAMHAPACRQLAA